MYSKFFTLVKKDFWMMIYGKFCADTWLSHTLFVLY